MTGLRIAADLVLPPEAVTQTFAILAIRGSGKTYTAAVMVENSASNRVKCDNETNETRPKVLVTPPASGQTNRCRRSVAVHPVYPDPPGETKRCTMCGRVLPLDQFGFGFNNKRGKSYRRAHCRQCDVAKAAAYRKTAAGKASRQREHRRAYLKRRAWWEALWPRLSCVVCGETDYVALDLHHLDPSTKEFNIARMRGYSFGAMKREVAKCCCLCANCHRKLHAGRLSLPEGTETLARVVKDIGS